jgi:DNA-binding GntR family transcriptional regulator
MSTVMDDKSAAELAKLNAETELIKAQTRKTRAQNDQKLQIELGKMMAESDKIRAENAKIQAETRWYPWIAVGLAALGILATAAVGIFKVIHG